MRADRACGFAAVLALAASSGAVYAQDDDVPRAPRLTAPAGAEPVRLGAPTLPRAARPDGRPPNAARLAPAREQREGTPDDEIVVIGQGFRLPDLGSRWREQQEEQARERRLTLLPLYDPSQPPLHSEALIASGENRRHGYIELFRLRFGRRARE